MRDVPTRCVALMMRFRSSRCRTRCTLIWYCAGAQAYLRLQETFEAPLDCRAAGVITVAQAVVW
jgi:hypothetical protein